MVRVSRYSSIESRSDERVVVVCVKGRKEEANGSRRRSECRRLIFTYRRCLAIMHNRVMTILDLEVRTIFLTIIPHNAPENHPLDEILYIPCKLCNLHCVPRKQKLSVCWKTELRKVGERMRNYWNFNVRNSIGKRSSFAWHGEFFAPFAVWIIYIAIIFLTKR